MTKPPSQDRKDQCCCGANDDGLPRMDILCPVHDTSAPFVPQKDVEELDQILTHFLTFTLGNEAVEANPKFAREDAKKSLLAWHTKAIADLITEIREAGPADEDEDDPHGNLNPQEVGELRGFNKSNEAWRYALDHITKKYIGGNDARES